MEDQTTADNPGVMPGDRLTDAIDEARRARRMTGFVPPVPNDVEPRTIDEARLQMVEQLHRAVFGAVWARPESPADVWADLLARVDARFSAR